MIENNIILNSLRARSKANYYIKEVHVLNYHKIKAGLPVMI
jgi:hypothetical protein